MTLDPKIEALAQWLHDEVDYPDPDFPNHSWPEHPDDTGQRCDGWLKIIPKNVQEQFRDIAKRLHHHFTAPSGQAPLGGGVKPLDWREGKNPDWTGNKFWRGQTAFDWAYRIYLEEGRYVFRDKNTDFDSLEAAKAAARADYEQRIRSALLPASAEPAWWLVVNQHGEAVSAHKVKEAALGHESGLWSGDELVPLYASPPASGAVEAGTPGAPEAFAALDVADRIIERAFGTEVPGDWHEAYRAVAKARSRKTRRRIPAAPTEGR